MLSRIDPEFIEFQEWLKNNEGIGIYENTFDCSTLFQEDGSCLNFTNNFDADDRFSEKKENSADSVKKAFNYQKSLDILEFNGWEASKPHSYSDDFELTQGTKKLIDVHTVNKKIVLGCKDLLGYLIEIIRKYTGLIFVRGWSGQRVNTIILKAHCKQDKHYQVLKPRDEVKKCHDPDNLKQYLCGSSLSLHCNFNAKTIKVCFLHSIKHEILPMIEPPLNLEDFISKNICFSSKECFDCVKRVPEFAEFVKNYDSKKVVTKIWKKTSRTLWNLDENPVISALKLLEHYEVTGDIKVLNPKSAPTEIQESIKKAAAIGFIYKDIINEVKEDVTEVVIDSTHSLSDEFKQYFVIVASYHGKGVPIGTMMTHTNKVDHLTIKWFLQNTLEDLRKVACINTDWALSEIKAIEELKYSNQICLFHTLNSVRRKRYATIGNLKKMHSRDDFKRFLEYEWVDHKLFYSKLDEQESEEKITETHIRKVVKLVKLAVCDHLVYYSDDSCINSKEKCSLKIKFRKIYEHHLKKLYCYIVAQHGLIFYFAYLFDQYYNEDSFKLMSRLGKENFFSTLRTSMMCESYFNQLKSWTLGSLRPPRIDTLIYIIMNKEIPKIKDSIKQTQRFEKCMNEDTLVQTHNKMLPTWRKQWILEWKNLAMEQKKLGYTKVSHEIQIHNTKLSDWVCSCEKAKLSPTSSCVHLFRLYQERYPSYHGYHLQRFGKRRNWLPLIEHSSLRSISDSSAKSSKNAFHELGCSIYEKDSDDEEFIFSENEEDFQEEIPFLDDNSIEADREDEKKIEIFQFFLSQSDTREIILRTPYFTKILEEMTYVIDRAQQDKKWRPKTNTPENGFEYQSWIRSLKYYQQYILFKQTENMTLPI